MENPEPSTDSAIDGDAKYNERRKSVTAKKLEALTERSGPKGLEPTRFGDWERNGRCIDF